MSVEAISSPEQAQPWLVGGEAVDSGAMTGVRKVLYGNEGSLDLYQVGMTERTHYLMEDGTLYEVQHHEPINRDTDVGVWTFPAFATGIDGHNKINSGRIVGVNIPVAQVGPPNSTSDESMVRYLPENPPHLKLNTIAEHMHAIITLATQEKTGADHKLHFYDRERVVIAGESQGGLISLVMKAAEADLVLPYYIAHTKIVAPVFPRGIPLKDIPANVKQLVRNPVTALKECFGLGPTTVWDLLHTFPHSKSYLKTAAGMIPALLNGEVGEAAIRIPYDADMAIRDFVGDDWCKGSVWQEIFKDHPRVTVEELQGSHLSIVTNGLGSPSSIAQLRAKIDSM